MAVVKLNLKRNKKTLIVLCQLKIGGELSIIWDVN